MVRVAVVALALAVTVVASPAAVASPPVSVLVITGRGDGHGVGMAQDGALQMGLEGSSLGQILGQFYPGTSIGRAGGDVRVRLLDVGGAPAAAAVTFPDGGQVVDTRSGPQSPGFPVAVPAGGAVVISWDGARYTARVANGVQTAAVASPAAAVAPPAAATTPTTEGGGLLPLPLPSPGTPAPPAPTTTTRPPARTGSGPSTTRAPAPAPGGGSPGTSGGSSGGPAAPPSSTRPLWALPTGGGALGVPARGRTYRGAIEAVGGGGQLGLVNELDVETYLTGMGEVINPSWPLQSLETQEIAARTYALRAMAAGGELCDDARCQVYLGTAGEYPAGQRAVAASAGEVLVAPGGGLADAVYSSNAGGVTATPQEGFGTDNAAYPYLRAAPYPTGNPLPWTVTVGAADAGARFGLPGPVTAVAVSQRGPSGRALAVTLSSGAASTTVSGLAFASAMGLESTLFGAQMGQSATAPAPPGPSLLQVPPDAAARLASLPSPSSRLAPAPPPGRSVALPATLPARGAGVGLAGAAVVAALLLLTVGGAAAFRAVSFFRK